MARLYKFIVLFFFIRPAFANQNLIHPEKNETPIVLQKDKDTSINLEYFNAVPDTIQLWGCRGEFTFDSSKIKKGKYIIFISDEGFAMILINSKPIYLNKISKTYLSHKKLELKFKGQGFEMTLTLSEKEEEYLVRHYSGTLTLEKGTQKNVSKIIGDFGC